MLWNVWFKDTNHNMTCKFLTTNMGHWDNPMENISTETINFALFACQVWIDNYRVIYLYD